MNRWATIFGTVKMSSRSTPHLERKPFPESPREIRGSQFFPATMTFRVMQDFREPLYLLDKPVWHEVLRLSVTTLLSRSSLPHLSFA